MRTGLSRLVLLWPALLWAAPTAAGAQQAMNGAEFDAYTRGHTLRYQAAGQPYGSEQYRANHRVTWAFRGDECIDGEWYEPRPETICFSYENRPDDQCWHFYATPRGLRAEFIGNTGAGAGGDTGGDTAGGAGGITLYEAGRSDSPLACVGPRIGA